MPNTCGKDREVHLNLPTVASGIDKGRGTQPERGGAGGAGTGEVYVVSQATKKNCTRPKIVGVMATKK